MKLLPVNSSNIGCRNAKVDISKELLQLGPAGLICVVLWVVLFKSEQREKAKDQRIQYLEHQLIESYDERIEAAERLSTALYESARAMEKLTIEVRDGHR